MEQRGGCCIARYTSGAYDMSKVDKIMLRFRPIAPKPASGNGSTTVDVKSTGISAVRGKRKRVSKDREMKVNNCTRKRKASSKEVKTLPLLPESPESVKIEANRSGRKPPLWLSFGGGEKAEMEMERRVVVWSWVKVECVSDTCVGGEYGNLGRTDEERVMRLDGDTCPGFVSDGMNRVRWMNEEYRRMVGGGGLVEVVAWVVVGEGVGWPAREGMGVAREGFTCRVKVVMNTGEGVKKCKTVPCDVWRMDCGGFAWRLDTKAELSLSL